MTHKQKDRKKADHKRPEFAPGNSDLLEEEASDEEKREGLTTRVTRLSLDEVDPS